MSTTIAPYSKALAAAIGILAQAVSLGLIPTKYQPIAALVISVGTAVGVYLAPKNVEIPAEPVGPLA